MLVDMKNLSKIKFMPGEARHYLRFQMMFLNSFRFPICNFLSLDRIYFWWCHGCMTIVVNRHYELMKGLHILGV